MFDRFTSRILIRGALQAETGLHIGVGSSSLDPSATDSPVIRDAGGSPFIPGSSLKGALRAHMESLLRGLGHNNLTACDPLADPCIPVKTQSGKMGFDDIKRQAEEASREDGRINPVKYDDELTRIIIKQSCDICMLFGSNWISARLMIKDLFIDPAWWGGRVDLRDGVGIDRDTQTARTGIKYDFEVIPASTQFKLNLVIENSDTKSLGLLCIGLRELEQCRISLGGKTTRGLGVVRLVIEEIEVAGDDAANALDGDGSADLLSYLVTGTGKTLRGSALRDYLKQKTDDFASASINGKE
jgi:CRISPR-associated RAMP protein (TIGR02581 family)